MNISNTTRDRKLPSFLGSVIICMGQVHQKHFSAPFPHRSGFYPDPNSKGRSRFLHYICNYMDMVHQKTFKCLFFFSFITPLCGFNLWKWWASTCGSFTDCVVYTCSPRKNQEQLQKIKSHTFNIKLIRIA